MGPIRVSFLSSGVWEWTILGCRKVLLTLKWQEKSNSFPRAILAYASCLLSESKERSYVDCYLDSDVQLGSRPKAANSFAAIGRIHSDAINSNAQDWHS